MFSKFNPLLSKYNLIRRINSTGSELIKVQNLLQNVETRLNSVPRKIKLYSNACSATVGRDKYINKIRDTLMDTKHHADISIIAIVAPVGFGKTGLAKLLYCSAEIQEAFCLKIWIDLSLCTVDIEEILQDIVSKSGKGAVDKIQLKNVVKSILTGQKCLIVLDGLHGADQRIAELKEALMTGPSTESKIVVTIHSKKVAKRIATVIPYNLPALSAEECCKIVSNTMRCAESSSLLAQHREDIGMKCNGIPLVAVFIGEVLSTGRNPDTWYLINAGELWKMERDIYNAPLLLHSYRLTYYNMPQNLRLCFAYCSILPKSSILRRQNITR